MLDQNRHKVILVKILKEIYADPDLRNILGFKGGTAAFLFYQLPRLSIDLDFDLKDLTKKALALTKIPKILSQFGKVIEALEKRETLFFLLSYEKDKRKIKLEISKRPTIAAYETQNYLGIPMLVIKKEDLAAGKLSAFLIRKKLAARDTFDLWFFLQNDFDINEPLVTERTGLSLKEVLQKAVKKTENLKKNQLLQGLGELLDEKRKLWVKEKLKEELLFQLKLHLDSLKQK